MDVLLGLVAEVLFGGMAGRSVDPAPAEGEWNASLGTMAAFAGALGAMFGSLLCGAVLLTPAFDQPQENFPSLLLAGIALACSVAAWLAANRAMRVTGRRRPLAHLGRWLAYATWVALAVTVIAFASHALGA